MDEVRGYLISVIAVCMITVIADVLIQKSSLRKIVRLIGGILVLLVAVKPLLSLDMGQISSYLKEFNDSYSFDTGRIKSSQNELLKEHIKQTAETYIEDKATELGGMVQAEISLSEGEYPVPVGVTLIGTLSPEQVQALSAYIVSDLGIPTTEQEWRLYG